MSIWKKIRIPSGEKVDLKAHEVWHVRWWSQGRIGNAGSGDAKERLEVFHNEEDAQRFANELRGAAKLLQDFKGYVYSSGCNWDPVVSKSEYKGA